MNTTLEISQAQPLKKSWLVMALLYGLPMGLLFSLQSGSFIVGLPSGMAAGALFSSLMTWFVLRQTQKFRAESPDFGTEATLHSGPANHFQGLEGVGGHLWLTNGRLHFRSHKVNLQNHEWSAPLSDIASAQATKTLGIIPNGFSVRLASGKEHRFIVNDHKRWAAEIMRARQSGPAS